MKPDNKHQEHLNEVSLFFNAMDDYLQFNEFEYLRFNEGAIDAMMSQNLELQEQATPAIKNDLKVVYQALSEIKNHLEQNCEDLKQATTKIRTVCKTIKTKKAA